MLRITLLSRLADVILAPFCGTNRSICDLESRSSWTFIAILIGWPRHGGPKLSSSALCLFSFHSTDHWSGAVRVSSFPENAAGESGTSQVSTTCSGSSVLARSRRRDHASAAVRVISCRSEEHTSELQ